MKQPFLLRLSNATLLSEFEERLVRDGSNTAELVAYLAEIDRRKLFRPAGYSSMYKYCVGHFHFSEASAYKRIHAARLMRKFPPVYDALAEGRVHLSGLVQLVPHVTSENVDDLLAAATHKSRRQIEKLLAERFPKADVPTQIRELSTAPGLLPEGVLNASSNGTEQLPSTPAPPPTETHLTSGHAPGPPTTPARESLAARCTSGDRDRVMPLSAKRYAIQFTMDEPMHDLLKHAQELLGHRVAPGDIAAVFGRALRAYVALLEHQKFAETDKPKSTSRPTANDSRHIPAYVKRAVWKRDGGQCTFVGENGHRCEERSGLEYDHVLEYARGGQATIAGIRLLCRAHNQLEAELAFGEDFMAHKREQASAVRDSRGLELAPGRVFDTGVTAEQASTAAL